MTVRLDRMRSELISALKVQGSRSDWGHLSRQRGLFAYTGLSSKHVDVLRMRHHVYMQLDGRLAVTGLNRKNVDYVAEAIETVMRYSDN